MLGIYSILVQWTNYSSVLPFSWNFQWKQWFSTRPFLSFFLMQWTIHDVKTSHIVNFIIYMHSLVFSTYAPLMWLIWSIKAEGAKGMPLSSIIIVYRKIRNTVKAAPNYKPLPIIGRTKLPNLASIYINLLQCTSFCLNLLP